MPEATREALAAVPDKETAGAADLPATGATRSNRGITITLTVYILHYNYVPSLSCPWLVLYQGYLANYSFEVCS
jgi:hypothetical protein